MQRQMFVGQKSTKCLGKEAACLVVTAIVSYRIKDETDFRRK